SVVDHVAHPGERSVTLSPDGRWLGLGQQLGDHTVLRDLTDTAEVPIPAGYAALAWSGDAAHLLLRKLVAGPPTYGVVDLPGGRLRAMAPQGSSIDTPVALLDDHRALMLDGQGIVTNFDKGTPGALVVNDLSTQDRRRVDLHLAAMLRPGETTTIMLLFPM